MHPPQKLQHPQFFSVCLACLSADADNFSSAWEKTLCLASFFARKKKDACNLSKHLFFLSSQVSLPTKEFLSQKVKKLSASAWRKAHTRKTSQDAAIAMEDAITYSLHSSAIETSCLCSWRTWLIPYPGGCRISSGESGTRPSISQRRRTYNEPFSWPKS